MKITRLTFILLSIALLAAMTCFPAVRAEESSSGFLLRYRFTEGETRQYRYTMTIADGDSLNAELIVMLDASVGKVSADGVATVDVSPSLVSFKARTKERSIELVPGQAAGAPQPGTPEAYALQLLNSSFRQRSGLQVDSFGQIRRLTLVGLGPWTEAMCKYPDIFCALYIVLMAGKPSPAMLPFWVHYPGKPVSIGESWDVPYEHMRWDEGLDFTWMLKEKTGVSAALEQLPVQNRYYLTFGENWGELTKVPGGKSLPVEPRRVGLVEREEKYHTVATLAIDPTTGWVIRYQATASSFGLMTLKKAGLPWYKQETPISSTIATVLELLRPLK